MGICHQFWNHFILETCKEWDSQGKEAVCECLWQFYNEYHPATHTQVKVKELALEPFLEQLSAESGDALFGLISDLCTAYQKASFLDGLHLGVRLREELFAASESEKSVPQIHYAP